MHTLVLDGLSVTAELVHDILTGPSFRIRILSLRDVKNLNERKLQQALTTACRPNRLEGTPYLKAIYLFTRRGAVSRSASPSSSPPPSVGLGSGSSRSTSAGSSALATSLQRTTLAACGAEDQVGGDAWYDRRGKMINRGLSREWANTVLACRGVIAFDTVLCAGPRHPNSRAFGQVELTDVGEPHQPQWEVATHAVDGCAGCGDAPEGMTVWGHSDPSHDFPLLAPAPLHSSSVKEACCPSGALLEEREPVGTCSSSSSETGHNKNGSGSHTAPPSFVPRCFECLRGRFCWSCNRWWCESCYAGPGNGSGGGADDKVRRIDGLCGDC